MLRLEFCRDVIKLEQKDQWFQAAMLQRSLWENNNKDLNLSLCAILQHWYAMMELEYLAENPLAPDRNSHLCCVLEGSLREITHRSDELFMDELEYNLYTGYVFTISPLYWGGFDQINAEGHKRIKRAYQKAPHNVFVQMLYYGSVSGKEELYDAAHKQYREFALKQPQTGPSVLEYFNDL
ncbi:MAG: hypothetical protein IKM59_05345 [Oscillospiraceae bacterium]|nr:hypothetical protein [Oscillospiraceae bacterium]